MSTQYTPVLYTTLHAPDVLYVCTSMSVGVMMQDFQGSAQYTDWQEALALVTPSACSVKITC